MTEPPSPEAIEAAKAWLYERTQSEDGCLRDYDHTVDVAALAALLDSFAARKGGTPGMVEVCENWWHEPNSCSNHVDLCDHDKCPLRPAPQSSHDGDTP
jgi:hypothetical protein